MTFSVHSLITQPSATHRKQREKTVKVKIQKCILNSNHFLENVKGHCVKCIENYQLISLLKVLKTISSGGNQKPP